MHPASIKDEVLKLIHEVPLLNADEIKLKPASRIDIRDFENQFGLAIPLELLDWLLVCNGAPVKPGAMLSLKEIGQYYDWHPTWVEKGWIPLASDGCGDSYVLATKERIEATGTHPIHFVDQSNYLLPAYVVASGLWNFLLFLFKDQIIGKDFAMKPEYYADELLFDINELKGAHYWPFYKRKVLEEDPGLSHYVGEVPFPWKVEQ